MKALSGLFGLLTVLCIIGSIIISAGACATTVQSSALLGVPTCDQTTTEIFSLSGLAFIFLIVSIVLAIKTRKKPKPTAASTTQQPSSDQFCVECGAAIPTRVKHCPKCGAKQP